jgi:hypothetical protein
MDDNSVCVIDFCGFTYPGHFPVDYAAWYHPDDKEVWFYGDLESVPNMPSDTCPSEHDVWQWVSDHESKTNLLLIVG